MSHAGLNQLHSRSDGNNEKNIFWQPATTISAWQTQAEEFIRVYLQIQLSIGTDSKEKCLLHIIQK